ncbi:Low-density lipoprotein receptor-related protein 4 [Holothuria leucospilota]|uniref:Low-density lipoprotein receptor-related protein 4 n=1 Tax=Holothuria leucospilota TaxID=206669 RepID=A0A9Q1BPP9_HOLLE|nr:Low-density lipoprotein receptor-related protein 4 [Holothuria leucospilota]
MKNYWLWYGFFLIATLVAIETDAQDADENTGLVCPDVPEGTQGACVHECDSDANCTADLKCCSNGCGMTCVTGVTPEPSEPPRLVWTEVFIAERKSRVNSLPADPLQYVGNSTISTRYKYQLPTRNFLAVAGDYEAGVIFFSDGVTKQIYIGGLQDEATATVIYHGTSQTVEGIAVDWIAKNVYWCDAGYDWIRMANYSGKNARTVVDTGLDKPRDIVVYPQKGFMYWTDWGVNVTSISRATLAGDGVAALVTSNLHYPNGLAIDYETDKIFWVDANPSGSRVESVSLDGLERRLVYTAEQGQSHFFDIAPFQNYLFLTDWYGNLQCLHKDSGEHFFSLSLGTRPYSIMTYGKELQPAYPTSPCLSNPCEQLCVHDSEGEYKCMCADGYRVSSNGTCEREEGALIKPKVLLLSRSKLCYYPANFPDISIPEGFEAPCIIQERTHAVALAVDVNANWVFFSDFQLKRLYRVRLVPSSQVEQISGAVGSVEGMAVDYINQNLYWTDYKLNHIVVANYDGSYRVTLVDTDINKPRNLVIHMETRTMFWTESGTPFEIEQSDLEGQNRRVVFTLQHSPSGLAYDHVTGQLIFGETGSGTIFSYNLATGVLGRLHSRFQLVPFYDMEVFGDYLVWTEWGDSNGVHAINLETRVVHQTFLIGEPVYGVRYYSNVKQRANATAGDCGDDNGGCNQLCIATESSHRCMCSVGFVLGADMMTCETGDLQEDNFALVTDSYRKTVYQVDMTSDSFNYTPIALDGLKNPIAVDYDPVEKKIYFTDVLRQTISRANLNGTGMEDIASDNVMTPDGLAVDYISRLVFWTDAGTDTISVSRLDGSYRRSLIKDDLENPRAITLDPFEGVMFWTDWGSTPKIEKSYVDGSERQSIVRGNLTWVNGLTLDKVALRLYWCDARTDVIETSRYDGSDRYVFLKLVGPAHPFGLGIFGNFIYWTDWVQRGLLRADKTVPLNETTIASVGPHTFLRLNGIIFYSSGTALEGETQCTNNGGGCEQICLITRGERVCLCEDGSGILEDGVSCQGRDELCPLVVPNGQFSYHCERVPGGQCVVDCEEGYFASLKSFTCQDDFQWNYPLALICQAVTCPLLNTTENAEVYECKPPHTYNSVCALRCKLGFTFASGTEKRTCQEDGTWSGEELVCETTTCPTLATPQGGTYQPSSCMQRETDFGSVCTVLCSQGYRASGPTALTCEASGSWNVDSSTVQCLDTIPPVFSTCPDGFTVTAPRNSETFLYEGTDLGVTDNSGIAPETRYNLPPPVNLPEGTHLFIQTAVDRGNNTIECSYEITVTVNRCPVLPIPFNSDMSEVCPTQLGVTCNFQCNPGFQLVGSESLTCEESSAGNFSWSGRVPHCQAVTCEEPVVNEGSVREGCSPPYYPELNCYFRCRRGFEMVRGSNQRTCKVSGEWSGEPIECTRLMCGALAVLDNGSLDPPECTTQGVAVGESCTFICNEGFELDGPAEVQCSIDGAWNGMDSERTCQDVNGPQFNGTCPQDMTVLAEPGDSDAVVTWATPRVTDNEGQVLNITSSIQSGSRLPEGKHFIVIHAFDVSGNKGSCFFTVEVKVTRCPVNESSGEAMQGPCDTLVGSTCSFRCNVGFRLVGPEMLTCTWNGTSEQGTWSGEIPVCEAVTCPRFELTAGMHMRGCNFDVERVPYGSICTLFCDKGYYQVLEGIEQKCTEDGTWQGVDFTCRPVTCEGLYPSRNSTVSPASCTNSSSAGDVCTFSCDEGFTILGSPNRTCSTDGSWDYDGQVPVCKDIERPRFLNCPRRPVDVQIQEECQTTTPVRLPDLQAEDNSGQVFVRILGLMERQLPVGLYTNFFIAADPAGLQAVCIIVINVTAITCPMPTGIRTSRMTCRNYFGSEVLYECPPSFHLRGSRTASCQLNGTWSTPPPVCEELDCPPLVLSGYLQQDAPCSADNLGITRCDVVCPFNQYSVRLTCSPEGLWKTPDGTLFDAAASSARCEDNVPPVITCPEPVRVELPADSSTVEITFGSATAVDTGDPNPEITGPSSPVTVGVGSSEYVFRALDSSGNSALCSVSVEVVDVTPPVAADCPANPIVIQNAVIGDALNWTEPTFTDNAGSLARVTVNRSPGVKLSYYGKINIKYKAQDASGNMGICEFVLIPTVAGTGCKSLPDPVNGVVSCNNSRHCVLSCNDGYVLLSSDGKPQVTALYTCHHGVWNYDSPNPIIPSCAMASTRKMRIDLMRFSLTDATCAGNEETMKEKFMEVFQTSAFKDMVDNDPKSSASITDIQVECGPSARRRRAVDDNNSQANITFVVRASSNSTNNIVDQAFNLSIPDFFGPTNPTIDFGSGTAVLVPESSVQGLPLSDCLLGQVEIGGMCVLCPSGTYAKLRTQSCVKCPVGTYQDKEGQRECTNCEARQSTRAAGAYKSSMCKHQCQPGEYSYSGLASCNYCPVNTYQPNPRSRGCELCPEGTFNTRERSAYLSACQAPQPETTTGSAVLTTTTLRTTTSTTQRAATTTPTTNQAMETTTTKAISTKKPEETDKKTDKKPEQNPTKKPDKTDFNKGNKDKSTGSNKGSFLIWVIIAIVSLVIIVVIIAAIVICKRRELMGGHKRLHDANEPFAGEYSDGHDMVLM